MMDRLRRDLKGIYTIWYRDVLRFVRDRVRIVTSLVQPALYLFVFAGGLAPADGGKHPDLCAGV